MGFRFSLSLDRVTGRSTTGKYYYSGYFSFCNKSTLTEAKECAAEEIKTGHYNHATIHDRETGEEIERFTGTEWRVAPKCFS
jgi:hypothetical protein